jgi:hypothetical protein
MPKNTGKGKQAFLDAADEARKGPNSADIIIWDLPQTARAKALCARHMFYCGRQHTHQTAEWDGSSRDPGVGYLQERLAPQGFVPTNAAAGIPWGLRRPNAPASLHRQIVNRFSDMLMGRQGRPTLAVPSDPNTEAYLIAVMKESGSWATLHNARSEKGARGSAAVVVSVIDGESQSEVLLPENLWIPEWEPGARWIPKHVFEQKMVLKEERDEETGKIEAEPYWQTRYWDDTVAIRYEDVPLKWNKEDPLRPIPEESSVEHQAGRCPVVWLQNTRNTESPEGDEDYVGTYQSSDRLDVVRSFAVRGTIANTDPTLHVSDEDRRLKRGKTYGKGHGAVIETTPAGSAEFIESSGDGVRNAWETAGNLRHDILQTAQCVIMDPETMSGYKSGEALGWLWKSMEHRADVLRVPLESEVAQIAQLWITIGAAVGVTSIETPDETGIILPPRKVEGETVTKGEATKLEAHTVGKGKYVEVIWGEYHRPTASQLEQLATALTTANGVGKVISRQTATGIMANALNLDSTEAELLRIEEEDKQEVEDFGKTQFPGMDPAGDAKTQREADKADDDAANAETTAAKAELAGMPPKPKKGTEDADE